MYFSIVLEKQIQLAPKYFGPQLQQTLRQKLSSDVEGQCTHRYGYIVAVTEIEHIGNGKISESNGYATFPVRYKAIVFRPFKNEVVDGIVTTVNKFGFYVTVGPMTLFISRLQIPTEMVFDADSTTPCYVGDEGNKIQKDSEVRLRILGFELKEGGFSGVGTVKYDYLGPTQS